jgi:YfiH family protein
MDDVYKIKVLNKFPQIKHAISTKAFGSMKKDDGSLAFANILKFAKPLKFASMPIFMNQVHGNTVAVIESDRELVLPETDGMITKRKDLPLAIITADCLPVLLYDPEKEVIGVAHAGRKGLLNGVIHKVVSGMQSMYGSESKDIIVGIGPSIEKECYEVDEKIITEFHDTFPSFINMSVQKENKYFLDLRAIALQSLQKEGILGKNIEISDICTKDDERFFSYRRGNENGRFVSVISLV